MTEKIYIQSIVRAVNILNLFANNSELRLLDISKMMKLNKSTTFGILETLVHLGYLEKNEKSNLYRLGLGLFRISQCIDLELVHICKPYLLGIAEICKETVNLIVLEGNHLVYLDKIETQYSIRIGTRIGQQISVYCSSAGKSILAYMPDKEVDDILNSIEYIPLTEKTITNKDKFKNTLNDVRLNGFATDIEEFEKDLICIGVPLLGHKGSPLAAITVSAPLYRMNKDRIEKIVGILKENVLKIATKLGHEE
ncbi:MAG: IclR family transcriptional regulator [Synergistaceae bacterium]|nr:IclR family transcriptional regulator [Synergistaceae bacterium]